VTFCTNETCGKEGFSQIPRERATEHARAETDYVHVDDYIRNIPQSETSDEHGKQPSRPTLWAIEKNNYDKRNVDCER